MNRNRTLAAAVVLALGTSAFAGPVEVDFNSSQSVKHLGSFSGTASYDNTTDKLTIDITNTSKGVLTAFAFEVEKGDKAKFERIPHTHWRDERNRKGFINTKTFGAYEGGAAVNGNWGSLASGAGLKAGKTGVFVFDVTGANASSLTTADFFTSTKPQIVASFAGFKHTHFHNDRAGGFGTVVNKNNTTTTTTTTPATTTTTNTIPTGTPDDPITNFTPPPIHGGPIATPVSAPTGAAVPLPTAAPAGFAMLGVLGIACLVRRVRKMMV